MSYLYTWYPDQTIAPFRCTKNILHGRSQRWDNLGSMYISKQSLRETSPILESRCEWNVELPGDPDNKLKCQNYSLVKQIIILFLNCAYELYISMGINYCILGIRIFHDLCLVNVSDESFVVQSGTFIWNFLFVILTRKLYFKIRKFACYNPSISQATTAAWAVASCREGDFWY